MPTSLQSSSGTTLSSRRSWEASLGTWASWAAIPTIWGHKRPLKPRLQWPWRWGGGVVVTSRHQRALEASFSNWTFLCLCFSSGHRSPADLDLCSPKTNAGLRCSISARLFLPLGEPEWRICTWGGPWTTLDLFLHIVFKNPLLSQVEAFHSNDEEEVE